MILLDMFAGLFRTINSCALPAFFFVAYIYILSYSSDDDPRYFDDYFHADDGYQKKSVVLNVDYMCEIFILEIKVYFT